MPRKVSDSEPVHQTIDVLAMASVSKATLLVAD